MAKTKGAVPFTEFEMDVMRLLIGQHGMTFAETSRLLGRSKVGVLLRWRRMQADGTAGQLCLPGFEPKLSESEGADIDVESAANE